MLYILKDPLLAKKCGKKALLRVLENLSLLLGQENSRGSCEAVFWLQGTHAGLKGHLGR